MPVLEPSLSLAAWQDAERLFRACREAPVPVTQPMVLVSQIQRSGGTLLNTLLDGHPELHSHPYELHIGHPTKHDWPALDLDAGPDGWLDQLREPVLERLFSLGYRKKPLMDQLEDHPTLPCLIVPTFIEHLFRLLCHDDPPASQRAVIDRYLTAFFNAWIDNQGLRVVPKRWVAAFAPRVAWGESRTRFFADYPDGRIISSLRDPRAWYASASTFSGRYSDFEAALDLWIHGAREIVAAKRQAPDRVFVLTYEALVTDTEQVMRAVAEWLGIGWDPILLTPTFNRLPTVANSSYDIQGSGVTRESLDAWSRVLGPETVAEIEERALDVHGDVRRVADAA